MASASPERKPNKRASKPTQTNNNSPWSHEQKPRTRMRTPTLSAVTRRHGFIASAICAATSVCTDPAWLAWAAAWKTGADRSTSATDKAASAIARKSDPDRLRAPEWAAMAAAASGEACAPRDEAHLVWCAYAIKAAKAQRQYIKTHELNPNGGAAPRKRGPSQPPTP